MWKPIAAISGPLVSLVLIMPLAPPAAAAPPPATSDPVPLVRIDPVRAVPVAVSKSGRYVVEPSGSRFVLRDRIRDRRIKRFPAKAEIVSISDSGRYVTYTLPYKRKSWAGSPWKAWRRTVKVYDRKTRKTRTATKTRSGKNLKPKWRTTCTGETCDEGIPITAAPQLDGGQISGNGRYIVFCANYKKRDRIDLYIKNWRTKSLKRINGACRFTHDTVGDERILPPSVSETGRVILLPGFVSEGDDSTGCWEPARALIKRRHIIQVGGHSPTMTHNGWIISSVGAPGGCDSSVDDSAVWWFDTRTQTRRPADVHATEGEWGDWCAATRHVSCDLHLTMQNASRRGRYQAWSTGYGAVPTDPTPGTYQWLWLVWDRTQNVQYDLGAALVAAGYQPQPSPRFLLSGSGRIAFLNTDRGAVAVRWSPGP